MSECVTTEPAQTQALIARAWASPLRRAMIIAVIVFVVAWGVLALTRSSGRIAALWPVNGIVVALLLRRPRREWPLLLCAALGGNIAANLVAGDALLVASVMAMLNALEIAIVTTVTANGFDPDGEFEGHSIGRFLGAALAGPIIPSLVSALWFAARGDMSFTFGLASWYGADTLGLLIVSPILLCARPRSAHAPRRAEAAPRRAEDWLLPLVAAALTVMIFSQDNKPLLFLLTPVVLLAAFRLRLLRAMLTMAGIAAVAIVLTARGDGPIAAAAIDWIDRIYVLRAFLATLVMLVLPVAAVICERDRFGAAWRHSERQFRRIAEGTPAGIAYLDLGGQVTFANHRWADLTGAAPRRFNTDDWLAPIEAEDRDLARAMWTRARSLHEPASGDLRYRGADGALRWAELNIYPELIAGRVVGLVARFYDVSRRHDVEQALHDSELLYRLLAENSHDVILRLDLDGRTQFVSSAARRLFGFAGADLIGRPLNRFIHGDDVQAFNALFPAANNGRGEATAQFRHRCATGAFLWVEASAHLVMNQETGEPRELVVSIRDIDARRHSELIAAAATARLRESNRLLTLAEALAHVGHWRIDAVSGSFECSPQVSVIADIPRTRSIEPADILALVHGADRVKLLRTLATARRGREAAECGVRLILADEMRHVRLVAQAEHDESDCLVGLFGVMRDITEAEITQAELIRARDEAREAARAKSDFLSTMSHEIRTPMTGVLGMIDLLRSDISSVDRDRYMATLKQSADLLMAILDDILDFSRIESGKIEFEVGDFDIEELVQSTLDLFDGAASQKGLLLALDHDRSGPSIVRGDAVRLQQVISNLLSNAIKFTAVGRVTVTLSTRSDALGSRRWRVEVRDTGIGIAAETLGSLFEPFVQAEAATSRRFGGTGLGLAISRKLVDAMGGKLGVHSRLGRGATFWFELTLPDGDLADRDQVSAADLPAARALDLLVADDNPVNQMIIGAILRRFGHRVTCVENGRQAVDLAALRRFDCILMDMQMPEMDGIAATRAIRASGGPCADTAIIALTADASSERRRFYDGAGLTDFLTKPIDRKALGKRLAALALPTVPELPGGVDPDPGAALNAIDLDRYNELRDVLGSSRVRDLLDLMALELDRSPARIRELVRRGDLDGARAEAHGLRGAASNVGATALGRVAEAIEAAMNGSPLGDKLEALDDQARRTVKAIAALR